MNRWNNDDVKKTIGKVKCGKSIRKAASKHKISEGHYVKQLQNMKRELIYHVSPVKKQV